MSVAPWGRSHHEVALNSFREMVEDTTAEGEQGRVEAARLAGEVNDPAFSTHLSRLIREDQSYRVVHAAMAAAGKGKYPGVVRDVVFRLGGKLTKAGARDALIEYGEIAVKELRTALFDSRTPRDIRLNIPRTLSKIHSQPAMNALLEWAARGRRLYPLQQLFLLSKRWPAASQISRWTGRS